MPIMTTLTVAEQLGIDPALSFVNTPRLFQTQYNVVSAARTAGNLGTVLHAPHADDFNGIPVGLEIEFENGDEEDIASALYDAGLTSVEHQMGYHERADHLYTVANDHDSHATAWRFEEDGSVSGGEVITPPMEMNALSLDYLSHAVECIVDAGGTTSRQAGMHTNITSDSLDTVEKWNTLFALWGGFEDTLYRLFANPFRTRLHRNNGYNTAAVISEAQTMAEAVRQNSNYGRTALNTANVETDGQGYIEFRAPDSSLHIPTMLTQIMVLTKMVEKASDGSLEGLEFTPQPRGTQRKLMKEREQDPRTHRLTGDQWLEATENVRLFCDVLFGDDTSKKSQVATLFAMNNRWPYRHRRG